MSKKVLVAVANGVEEVETISVVDVLRRAGAELTIASINDLQITASRGVKIIADKLLTDCHNETYDLIVIPGGMPGAENLRDSKPLIEMLTKQRDDGRWYAAICASPVVVFQHHGLLVGKKATAYPSMLMELENVSKEHVVVDQNCVTSQGPGTALEFGIKLVELLYGEKKSQEIAQGMLISI